MPGEDPPGGDPHGDAGARDGEPSAAPVEIPAAELSAELLRSIVESVVLREGTDYGAREFTFDEKVRQLIRQVERREAKILFDPLTETVAILPR